MPEDTAGDLTRILHAARNGDSDAMGELAPRVYSELKAIAHRMLKLERPDHTFQATALVNEAWLKIAQQDTFGFEHRRAFFAASATAMRRILVDHARTRQRAKRGAGERPQPLDEVLDQAIARIERVSASIMDVAGAIDALGRDYPQKAKLVELKCFLGMSMREAADVLGVSLRSVERDWTFAKAWLRRRLGALSDPA